MRIFTLLLTFLISSQCFAQWTSFYQVTNDNFYTLTVNNDQLFLGAEWANIYAQTTDNNFDIIELQGQGFLYEIVFVNDDIGYAGSGCYYTTPDCPATTLYKTTDGGLTWNLIKNFGSIGVVSDIEIVGENKLYVLSEYDGVQYSDDGGATWTAIVVDTEINLFEQLQFINENEGFILGHVHTTGFGYHNVLYKTTDAGQNWTEIYHAANADNDFAGYHFTDASTGFVTAKNGEIQKTIDGGNIWTTISITTNQNTVGNKVEFVTNQTGYVSVYDKIQEIGYLYRTDDGGDTWNLDLEVVDESIGDFYFSNTNNGYLIANSRKVYKRTGSEEIPAIPQNLMLLPNPTINDFVINIELPLGNYQLNVFDAVGRQILSTQDIYQKVNTTSWNSGVYFVEIRNENKELLSRGKLVKRN